MSAHARVAIKTLGCKLNQYESEQIREDFEALGFEVVDFGEPAEVHVINSCTVTHRTDRDTRRLSRSIKRDQPDALMIVTGCYAEVTPEAIEALDAVDIVVGNAGKPDIARLAGEWLAQHRGVVPEPARPLDPDRLVHSFRGHTRAFLKVQNGCDAHCAYCIIPIARGPSRSAPLEDALMRARALVEGGHPELALVGIHLGRWGADLPEPQPVLADLVGELCAIRELQRLRLSSIEPREVSDELVAMVWAGGRALSGEGKVCRHLHIPLQSGCDATLKRMRRPYRCDFYAELVGRITTREPRVAIGADVLTGFPGETDAEFEQTRAFVESLPVAYLHVFTFSAREGTEAATMPEQVNHEVRKRRTRILRDISEAKAARFAGAAVGETLELVVEGRRGELLSGISDNYLHVDFEGPDDLRGRVVAVRVEALDDGRLLGELR
jgi:threonylcarbamoyladenosine tRNA methylthiotransferase MtaB